MPDSIKKAVIPAAGLGTRFLPATKTIPKELLPIVDKPSIQIIVEEAIASGIEEIIFVISPQKEVVKKHFESKVSLEEHLKAHNKLDFLEKITFLTEKASYKTVIQEQALGLGHAVLCAQEAVGNNWFFVYLPDDIIDHGIPCSLQMKEAWMNYPGAIMAVMEVSWDNVHKYGVVQASPLSSQVGKVSDLLEKPKREEAPSNLAIIGRYLLPPSIFPLIEKTKKGALGEIQLTDALKGLITDPGLYAFQFEGERFDTGNKFGFLEANLHYALKDPEISEKTKELIKILSERR